jgi:hypothetical protein
LIGNHQLDKLTSFQDFPCARRGYRGALGLTNEMEFDTATSFGCNSNHVIINKSRLQNHLETTSERSMLQLWLEKRKEKKEEYL